MQDRRDTELVEPAVQLRKVLAELDALAASDASRGDRIAPALCHLQLAIDLLNEAQVTDT